MFIPVNSLNWLALAQNSETNVLWTSKVKVAAMFLLYKNLINIDQYVLRTVLGSLSLFAIFSVESFLDFETVYIIIYQNHTKAIPLKLGQQRLLIFLFSECL